ncbi:hypothetical protein GCM10027020_13270 [Nocardioides salsibiostraticola]
MIARGPGETTGHPDLAALVRGEADNDEILAAADHLDRCAGCRGDLTHIVIGHALLTRSSEVVHEDRATEDARLAYLAIDISVESDSGNPEHSPRSVLRTDHP